MLQRLKEDSVLIKKLLLTALSRGLAAVGTMLFNFVLARYMGATEYGYFMLAYAILIGFTVFARFGMPIAVLRFAGILVDQGAFSHLRDFRRRIMKLSMLSSFALGLLLMVLSGFISEYFFKTEGYQTLLLVMAVTLPFYSYLSVQSAFFKALKRPEIAPFFEVGLTVFITSALVAVTSVFSADLINPFFVGVCLLFATVSVWGTGQMSLVLMLRNKSNADETPDCNGVDFFGTLPDYALAGVTVYLLQFSPTLILGLFTDGKEVGLYAMANSSAFVISFILWVVEAVTAPQFAGLYSRQKITEIRELHKKVVQYMMFVAVPTLLVIALFSTQILRLFGDEFIIAKWALVIMAFGQFYSVLVGPVIFILNMCGHQRTQRNIVLGTALFSVVSAFLLIPTWGFLGAAVATTFGLIFRNSLAFYHVRKIIG